MSFQNSENSEDNKDHLKYSIKNFTNCSSENEQIDNFIQEMQEMQLKVKDHHDIVLEWIPYNQFDKIKETSKSDFVTIYSAIWKDGPLFKNWWSRKYTRNSNKKVTLNCLCKSQYPIEFLINESTKCLTSHTNKHKDRLKIYGISQNPDTNDYILVQNNSICLINWMSGNKKIDDFIREMQVKIKEIKENYNVIFEWIPYSEFNNIKDTGKSGDFITVYSAIWKDGPLYYDCYYYRKDSNKEVTLKCLHNSQNPVKSLINEVEILLTNELHCESFKIYGISQNPSTNDYILVFSWTSGNKKIDDFIQEMQLKTDNPDILFEWIPYNQLNDIREANKNSFMTVYSAIWKNGPLCHNHDNKDYERNPNKKVALKCLHDSRNSIESLMNELKEYSTNKLLYCESYKIYGISQNPSTNDYILVFSWTSGNKKIDDFIQEMKLKIKEYYNVIFEWIPYSQFNNIKDTGKSDKFMTVYSAIWKDGPLCYDFCYYRKDSNKEVALKCLHKSQNSIESLINEVEILLTNKLYCESFKIYGISQYPCTNDYILVFSWTSGNKKIDDFIQEIQLIDSDIIFEWIPYNQLYEIREASKNSFMTVYSAIWKNGPLYYNHIYKDYKRRPNRKVALKNLHDSQNSIESLMIEVNEHLIKKLDCKYFGISQNPYTNDYIIVQNIFIWASGNEKIDDFIQEMQLKIKGCHNNVEFEWMPYSLFYEVKEIGKNDHTTIYSAIWKDGPLRFRYGEYKRDSNKKVTLKCLHNSQNSIESLMNEVKEHLTKKLDCEFFKIYGISQNPATNDYIIVQDIFIWASGNGKIDDFIQEMQLKTNNSDIVFEWIPYNLFYEVKKIDKNDDRATIYSAIWKNGPLCYDNGYYRKDSNEEVTLKCLHNLQNPIESLMNEVKKLSIDELDCKFIKVYGISQNPDTNDYIIVQNIFIWASGNEKIDDFIQEMQLKTNNSDIVFEWIPYNLFYEIKEISKNDDSTTIYSAIWKDGPLCYDNGYYRKDSNEKVTLKCLHDSQNSIESLVNEVKILLPKKSDYESFKVYGISQNPITNDYILVFNWISGNEKIDDFIQEMQLKTNNSDIVFEWIPYNQFYEIREARKNSFMTVYYSAIWKNGPYIYKDSKRNPNKEVVIKCLHYSQNSIVSLINEVKEQLTKQLPLKIYGISQNPITNDYVIIQNTLIWASGNEKIDDSIQEMQSNIKEYHDIVFEWIPYNQFYEIKEIDKGGFATVYSAIWKDGPLLYLKGQDEKYNRESNKKVALKCLNNSQNLTNELLNEIKAYSTKEVYYNNSKILKVYGISQDPNTKNYIIVLQYAEGRNFNNWININENYKYFDWKNRVQTLYYIANSLKEIHEKQMVHHDFHTGNILFNAPYIETYVNKTYILDMGLCRKVGDINQNNIYGVMPYIAPEVLRGNPYTQAADIYSLGMVMYFVATGRQPFDNCAHDHLLALDICGGIRPEINVPKAPKSYIDLMKKCWDSTPENRPNITEFSESIWSVTFKKSEIEEAENYRDSQLSSLNEDKQITTHPQAVYTSRLLNPFIKNLNNHSECLDCTITDNTKQATSLND
ncbi:unnamed protein product [Rhizophagus irregularis]|nr:unnamed protein product [Rhizophagus irregularis]